jgi:asparagine synthase (glutamine-hydrolysing)
VFEAYWTLPAAVRARAVEPLLLGVPTTRRLPLVRKAASYIEQARLAMPDRLETYNLLTRLGMDRVLTRGFLSRVDECEPLMQQRAVYAECDAGSLVNRMLAFDWKYTLADNDLVKVCGATSLADISVGFPLLDDELTDFSLRLAPSLKVRGLRLRYFFKEALRGFLPPEIIRKKKHGFGLPFGPWAATDPQLGSFARDALRSTAGRGVVNPEFIDELLSHRLLEHSGFYGEMIWILVALEHWLRVHRPDFRAG